MINLSVLRNISRVKKCTRGTVITGAGIGQIMFIILKGEVGVYRNYKLPNTEHLSTLSGGELYTDPALLQDKKTMYTTVALSDAIIIPVEKKTALEFIQEEPALAMELIKELSIRLDSAGGAYTPAAVRDEDPHKNHEKTPEPAAAKPQKSEKAKTAEEKTTAVSDEKPKPSPVLAGPAHFDLFPAGHGSYELPMKEQNKTFLMNKNYTCPICHNSFVSATVRPSKLVVASTDKDMRYHFKGIEPLYYEVLTCPTCLYSALPDVFGAPDKSKQDIARELEKLKENVSLSFEQEKDTLDVFAGYYLALHCAPISFINHQLIAGKLYHKLSRIYQDAGDENMENLSSQQALEHYLYAYTKTGISDSQEQQVCILIGELYLKQNDLKNAISFFSKAKTFNTSPALKNHADNRIYEIRQLAATQS